MTHKMTSPDTPIIRLVKQKKDDRPISVDIAAILLTGAALLMIPFIVLLPGGSFVFLLREPIDLLMPFIITLSFPLPAAIGCLRGRKWGRWLYLAFMTATLWLTYSFLYNPYLSPSQNLTILLSLEPNYASSIFPTLLFHTVVSVLLFLPASNRYFTRSDTVQPENNES